MATSKKERHIAENQSVRLDRAYKRGDEDALYEQISPERAKQLQRAKILEGDWSGAKGKYDAVLAQREETRIARDPTARAIAQALGGSRRPIAKTAESPSSSQDEDSIVEDDEPDKDNHPGPYRLDEEASGGWYSFRDANDDVLLRGDGEPYKVRGRDEAEEELKNLNA